MQNQKETQNSKEGINICIGGKTISLKEFLKGEEEQEKTSEIEKEVKTTQKTSKRSIYHFRKPKAELSNKKIIRTKIYTREEIKMFKRKDTLLFHLLKFYWDNVGTIMPISQIKNGVAASLNKAINFPVLTALNSRVFKILSDVDPPLMMRERNESATGYKYKLSNIAISQFTKFDDFAKFYTEEERKTRALESASKPPKKKKPKDQEEIKTDQEEMKPEMLRESFISSEGMLESKSLPTFQIPENINIKVSINITLGFAKD